MAAISNVSKLVDKKRGSYSAIVSLLELGKFNKWKKRMLCYLTGIEPYYIQFKTFDWDKEEVSNDKEMTQVKVLMALTDDELAVGKNYARNDEWIDITMKKVNILLSMDEDSDWQNYLKDDLLNLKQAKLEAITFQLQNTKLVKQNHALHEQLKEEKHVNEKWSNSSNKIERHNPDSKLPNFNTRRILVPKSQGVNEFLRVTNAPTEPDSSKESGSEPLTPLHPLKNLQGAFLSFEVMPLTYQYHSPRERPGLGTMKHKKPESQESSSKSVSRPVTICNTKLVTSLVPTKVKDNDHYGFNDHHPDDCCNYPECAICRSYDHSTSGHNRVFLVKGVVLAESTQSSESSVGVNYNTCGNTVHSTTNHSDF
nr:hypothetical protein [Tanacetum cinerariifolium]